MSHLLNESRSGIDRNVLKLYSKSLLIDKTEWAFLKWLTFQMKDLHSRVKYIMISHLIEKTAKMWTKKNKWDLVCRLSLLHCYSVIKANSIRSFAETCRISSFLNVFTSVGYNPVTISSELHLIVCSISPSAVVQLYLLCAEIVH